MVELNYGNPAIDQAADTILNDYGDVVSVAHKKKSLNKFGRNIAVGTTFETVAEFQGTTGNETFVSTNIIDAVASSSASDTTQTLSVEGHTIDASGNMSFVAQDVVLNGQTEVALATPLARANRIYVKNSGTFNAPYAALVGTISVYDNTAGITSGVPNTAAATKLTISAGDTQSDKAATTISASDYWLIASLIAGIGNAGGAAGYVTVRMEKRDIVNGGVWRPMGGDLVLIPGVTTPPNRYTPLLVVPKNHDWRIVAKCDANSAEVFAEAEGFLAAIVG